MSAKTARELADEWNAGKRGAIMQVLEVMAPLEAVALALETIALVGDGSGHTDDVMTQHAAAEEMATYARRRLGRR